MAEPKKDTIDPKKEQKENVVLHTPGGEMPEPGKEMNPQKPEDFEDIGEKTGREKVKKAA